MVYLNIVTGAPESIQPAIPHIKRCFHIYFPFFLLNTNLINNNFKQLCITKYNLFYFLELFFLIFLIVYRVI